MTTSTYPDALALGRTVLPPVNLWRWIEAHRDDLQPPVGNKYMYRGDNFFVMVIGGPNARNDFHINNTEEWFHQLKGDCFVRIRVDGEEQDVIIREGETWMCPPRVPHSPQRPPGTIGLVVETERREDELDKQAFYCRECGHLVHESTFKLRDIVQHFGEMMETFWKDDDLRTCANCGTKVEPAEPRRSLTQPWGCQGSTLERNT